MNYQCIRCKQKLTLNTVSKTLDNKDLCHKCYTNTSIELCKGLFTSEEAYKVFKGQESQLSNRNNLFRIMLQATILNGDNTVKFLGVMRKEVRKRSKELYNKEVNDLLPREKTNIVELIYNDYKTLFGDFTISKCKEVSIRDIKGGYYEYLDFFNTDLDIKVVQDNIETGSSDTGCFFTSNTSIY